MSRGEIEPIGRSDLGTGSGAGYVPRRAAPPQDDETADEVRRLRRLDLVQLSPHRQATLRLLRQRVLENTRAQLGLSEVRGNQPHFVDSPDTRPEVYVGRLLSDQNLLAARRGGEWTQERIFEALEDGMVQGLSETLQILHEVEELDAAAWLLVNAVMEEFHRKLAAAAGAGARVRGKLDATDGEGAGADGDAGGV